jgi:hypothetical protein
MGSIVKNKFFTSNNKICDSWQRQVFILLIAPKCRAAGSAVKRKERVTMGRIFNKSYIPRIFLLIWSCLCIFIFIYFPGKISYIHWSNLTDAALLAEKLQRIDIALYIKELILSLAGMLFFYNACISLGLVITRSLNPNDAARSRVTPLENAALLNTNFLVGQGIFSLIFLSLGGLYKLTALHVFFALSLGLLLGWRQLTSAMKSTFSSIQVKGNEITLTKTGKTILWLSLFIFCISITHATARISYDSSAIYFSDAKLTAMTEQIHYFTDDTFVVSVFQAAIQYTALIQLFGDQAARMYSWLCGGIIIIFSLALAEKTGISKQAIVILLALILTSTAFVDLLGDGKIDLISSAPIIAAIYWMIVQSQKKSNKKHIFLLVGFLTGMAVITRPFNAFLMGIFTFLFYGWQASLEEVPGVARLKFFLNSLLWIGLGAIGLGIYHLLANWVILGNPLAFLSSVSNINQSSGPWDAESAELFRLRLLYPVIATFRNTPQSLGNISPLLIACLPMIFIGNARKRTVLSNETKSLTVISIVTLLIWIFSFFTVVEIRYVFFLWIIIFLPIAEIISSILNDPNFIFRKFEAGLLLLFLMFMIFRTSFISLDTYSPVDIQGNPKCYDFVLCKDLGLINAQALPGERVLNLSAYRYYLRTDLLACSTTHEEYSILQKLSRKDPKDFWNEVYRQGYTYIAYENEYSMRHLRFGFMPGSGSTAEWIKLEPISDISTKTMIYRIHYTNPPLKNEVVCRKDANNIWRMEFLK